MSPYIKTLFAAFFLVATIIPCDAQTTGKKKFVKPETTETKPADKKSTDAKEPEAKSAPEKVEKEPSKFGYGVNIGNLFFTNTSFSIGLDPNVAYKLNDVVAVGFMLKMNYYYERLPQYDLKYNGWDWGPTIFTRVKPLLKMEGATPFMQGIFIQAEYEKAFISRPTDEFGNIDVNGDNIVPFKSKEDYLYIGVGMASGYPFSSFVSFHYNIIDNIQLSRVPFTYRIGFTWNY